jgi:uncharacterized membrane protein
MAGFETWIEVAVPVRTAYNQWTQFEEFPHFMEGVERVTQLSDSRLVWRANIFGKVEEWEARITDQTPDRRVAWESTSGAPNAGVVSFQPIGPRRTRIGLHISYEPQGPLEALGDKLGLLERRVQGDLERFKSFIESRGHATGAWRGAIDSGIVTRSDQQGEQSHDQ